MDNDDKVDDDDDDCDSDNDDLGGHPAAELAHVAIQLVPALHQGCLAKTTDEKEAKLVDI